MKIKRIQMKGMILILTWKWMITRLWKSQQGLSPTPSLPVYDVFFFILVCFFFHPDSDPFLPFLISFFCHRRSNILGVRVKREFSENETKVQVFCISFALHSCRLSVIIILIYVAFCRMLAELHLNIEDWNPW